MKKRDKALFGLNSIFIRYNLLIVLLIISISFSACISETTIKKESLCELKPKYKTAKVEKGVMLFMFNGAGQIISTVQQNIYFKIGGGYIKSINFKQGDVVKKVKY